MLPFFRKIRYNLARDNQFLKYSRYAVGEIILVVIGILIALQINNWNEQNKLDAKKKVYFDQLLKDIGKDTVNINRHLDALEYSIKTYDAFIDSWDEANLNRSDVFKAFVKVETSNHLIIFNNNTIISLLNTGNIELMPTDIRNDILEITNMYSLIESQRDQLIPQYSHLITEATKSGWGSINDKVKNQPELEKIINLELSDAGDAILSLNAAFDLKNHIEKDEHSRLTKLKNQYQDLESKIVRSMN